MHRDLKIDNLMLRAKGSTVEPVIIDFGLAEYYSNEKYLFECCGTPGWMAPELFLPHKADHPERCDLFSLGVILHQM